MGESGEGGGGMMDKGNHLSFILNNEPMTVEIEPDTLLLDLLREKLGLTGTKRGCGEGECGACTVIVNEEAVDACIYPAWKVENCRVMTVEGLGSEGNPHPLQEAFLEAGAVQCGFCSPGMLMSSYALLLKSKDPCHDEIKSAIAGNLCRCTGYIKIFKAIKMASQRMSEE
jgi:aerobic carbon-monoxide dehydrogenase small subunit